MRIEQAIRQIKSKNLDSGFDSLEKKALPEIEMKNVDEIAEPGVERLRYLLSAQTRRLAHDALMEYDRNADARQEILLQVIHDHLRKRLLLGHTIHDCEDQRLLEMAWAIFDQIRATFLNPALIASVLSQPPRMESREEQARQTV